MKKPVSSALVRLTRSTNTSSADLGNKVTHPIAVSISNAYARQVLAATREVLGLKQLDASLNQAGLERLVGQTLPDNQAPVMNVEEFARFMDTVAASVSNPRAGRQLLRRIGRAWFDGVLRGQPLLFNLARPMLSIMSLERRIRFVLEAWVTALTRANPGSEAWLEEAGVGIAYIEHTCPVCFAREEEQPICHLTQGALEAAVLWATGKKRAVTETECRALGADSCRFVIDLATAAS
jgi:predicted hydrocarbon binding protein